MILYDDKLWHVFSKTELEEIRNKVLIKYNPLVHAMWSRFPYLDLNEKDLLKTALTVELEKLAFYDTAVFTKTQTRNLWLTIGIAFNDNYKDYPNVELFVDLLYTCMERKREFAYSIDDLPIDI